MQFFCLEFTEELTKEGRLGWLGQLQCKGYYAMYQCIELYIDLKLSHEYETYSFPLTFPSLHSAFQILWSFWLSFLGP